MLNWVKQFSIFLLLDSNGYPDPYGRYDYLLAAGAVDMPEIIGAGPDPLATLQQSQADWLFGHVNYDYKNLLEPQLSSRHPERHRCPLLHFFCPKIICAIPRGTNELVITVADGAPEDVFREITATSPAINTTVPALRFDQRTDRDTYLRTVEALRRHLEDGDCYEINYCNEGFCTDAEVDPLPVFHALNTLSPAPFAAYYRLYEQYMICASPERYLQKSGDCLRSQPIKGTARRHSDPAQDAAAASALRASVKERAENVMIADLVRNDLARTCIPGTVRAEELFGIYSFPQVHQMISTISGNMVPGAPFTDAIRYSFPMGSMTGAPKVRVMQLIEQYEQARRELYSGTVGYITPERDFDFNVVIRSLFYNASDRYLSYQTGGAITYDSDPVQEWEEMRLKAWALERVFN
jgi:para-aminobenzoate synthetase component 1